MFLNKTKKYFYVVKYFVQEEKILILLLSVSILFVVAFIFTNRLPEKMIYGTELMTAFYDIAIALFVGVMFYFFQVFLPKIDRRRNAQRELNFIVNDLNRMLSLIIENYYTHEKLFEIRFSNNPSRYIYNNIDLLADFFEKYLKLDDIIKFNWNKDKKTFYDELIKRIKNHNKNYRELILKYGDILENKTLDSLENIYEITFL